MRRYGIPLVLAAIILTGCSRETPLQPSSRLAASAQAIAARAGRADPGPPGYEQAYVENTTVTINAIEVPGKAPLKAQADFYEVVYPPDWKALGIAPPQCNPCDHDQNGIDALDFHDHVLDSRPGIVGYRAPWHVYAIVPAYNGDAAHDAAVGALYKAHLPLESEAAVDDFLTMTVDGGPAAVKIDANFYFLCAVVGGPHPAP